MMILALEREAPGLTAADFSPHLKAEAAQVWELHQAGIIRQFYFNTNDHTAVLILECTSIKEAADTLAALPLVTAGLVTFEIIPLAPYPGFARLFEIQSSPVHE